MTDAETCSFLVVIIVVSSIVEGHMSLRLCNSLLICNFFVGSNICIFSCSHGNQQIFSCRGIKICLDWFLQRGHKDIYIFVPSWRKEAPNQENVISNQEILYTLEQRGYLTYTPSRRLNGRRVVCYDDRYILKLASEIDGIVVSNDAFRDLSGESEKFKDVIE